MTGLARRRVVWGLLDQVLSSFSNFLVTILAARALSAAGFGTFAVAMAVAIISASIARGVASDPLLAAHASDDPTRLGEAVRAASATALVTSLMVALVAAVIGAVLGGDIGAMLLMAAVLVPGVTLQDFLRFALIVRRQAKRAFFNDFVWCVLQVPLMLGAIALDGDPVMLLLAWGTAGYVAAGLGLAQAGTWVGHPRRVRGWLRDHRHIWHFFLLDNLVFQATNLVLVVVIALVTTMADVGGFRATMTVYAPLAIIGRGVVAVALPELARRRNDPMAVRRLALTIGLVLAPMSLIWALLTLLIPDSVGRQFLGDSWEYAEPLLLLFGASNMVALFAVGAIVGIRALSAGRDGLTARLVIAVLVLSSATVGAFFDGARGAVIGLAMSAPAQLAIWWIQLAKAVRRAMASEDLQPRK